MKAYIENVLLHSFCSSGNSTEAFLALCTDAGVAAHDRPMQIDLGWPSLLEYIGLGSLFADFQAPDEHNAFLAFVLVTLSSDASNSQFMELYDRIFLECLTSIKDLPEIQPAFLLSQIQGRQNIPAAALFSESLEHYAKILVEDPYNTVHDLTLYLAWDRVCVFLAVVFERFALKHSHLRGLEVFKGCLLESFQHITGQQRTSPCFFRCVEALYAYHMRQENLQIHTVEEWQMLCQGACALKPRDKLSDVPFIDAAVVDQTTRGKSPAAGLRVFTLNSLDHVAATIALANGMMQKLQREVPNWHFTLSPVDIICLKK